MKINVISRDGVVRIAAEEADALVQHNAAEFRDGVLAHLNQGKALLISCSWIKSIDSAGVGSLVRILKAVQRRGSRMALVGVQPQVLGTLKTIRLTSVFEIFESDSAALAALASTPVLK